MKRTTIIAAMLLIGVSAFATGTNKSSDNSFAIANNSLNQFKLVYLQKEEGMVKIYLKNEKGQILHRSNVKNAEGFAQNFDLSQMPAGEYTFSITEPDGTTLKDKVKVKSVIQESNFNANILNVNDDKKFRLAVLNKDDNAFPTSVNIYDKTGNIIHTETITNLVGFRKIYDLSEVEDDSFVFEVKNISGSKYFATN